MSGRQILTFNVGPRAERVELINEFDSKYPIRSLVLKGCYMLFM